MMLSLLYAFVFQVIQRLLSRLSMGRSACCFL